MIERLDYHKDQAGAWDVLEAARGRLAFDVGANIGQSTKVLAQNFEKVIAFEPCAESFEILKEECPPNVTPWNWACSARLDKITLFETNQLSTGQLTSGPDLDWGPIHGEREVHAIPLQVVRMIYGRPDFVKIDTEGHEVEVLRGWPHPDCPLIVEVHKAENEEPVRELLAGYDLTKLEHDPERVGEETRRNHFWLASSELCH